MARDSDDKIILNSEQYPGNSFKSKKEAMANTEPRVKRAKVASARRVKKSLIKRFADSFKEGGAGHEVGSYIMYDVVIPAAKSTIADLVEGAIDMILFGGDTRSPRLRRNKGRSYVSYSDLYDHRYSSTSRREPHTVRKPHNVETATRIRHDFTGVVLGSRAEAEIVLAEMVDLVNEYGVASVSDLYDLVGLSSEYTDNKYGWFDLEGASTARVRDGWALELPRPRIIE